MCTIPIDTNMKICLYVFFWQKRDIYCFQDIINYILNISVIKNNKYLKGKRRR